MSNTTELLQHGAELFPGEVVTTAHVRHLDLPLQAGKLALITLDNGFDHTKPTTFGPGSLLKLSAALDQVEAEASEGKIVGAAITGMRPIVEIQFSDFTAQAMDQIANQAANAGGIVCGFTRPGSSSPVKGGRKAQ